MNTRKFLSTLMLIAVFTILFSFSIAFAAEKNPQLIATEDVEAIDSGDTEDKEVVSGDLLIAEEEAEDESGDALISGEEVEDSGDEELPVEKAEDEEETAVSGEAAKGDEELATSGEVAEKAEEVEVVSGEATLSGEAAVSGETAISGDEAEISGEVIASGDAVISGTEEAEPSKEEVVMPTDVVEGSWYEEYVEKAIKDGFMENKEEDKFMPLEAATIGEALDGALYVEAKLHPDDLGLDVIISSGDTNPLADNEELVEDEDYVSINISGDDAETAEELLVKPITREEIAKVVYAVAKMNGKGFKGTWAFLLEFDDVDEISDDAYEAIAWCNMTGVIVGRTNNRVCAKDLATRAELATILVRLDEVL